MVKGHNNKITIRNNTNFAMVFHADWFQSGRLADQFKWKLQINPGEESSVLCFEKNWAVAGCSGYVQYQIDGFILTIGFSNPSVGNNKVGVGITGKSVWEEMTSNEYQPQVFQFGLNHMTMRCQCICSGGDTNVCDITLHQIQNNMPPPRNPSSVTTVIMTNHMR